MKIGSAPDVTHIGIAPNGSVFAAIQTDVFTHSVFRSADHGATWTKLDAYGPFGSTSGINSLFVDSSGHVIVSRLLSGAVRSTDNGASWHLVTMMHPSEYKHIAAFIEDSSDNFFTAGFDGIHMTLNGGASWKRIDPFPFNPGTNIFFMNSQKHFFASSSINTIRNGDDIFPLIRSTDYGTSWEFLRDGFEMKDSLLHSLVVLGNDDMYAVSSNGGIYVSRDGGETWDSILQEIDAAGMYLTVNRFNGLFYLWKAADGVMLVSSDSARTWENISGNIQSMSVLPPAFDTFGGMIIASAGDGIFHSDSLLTTMTPMHNWFISNADINVQSLVTLSNGIMVAGTNGSSLLRSSDHGATWQKTFEKWDLYQIWALGSSSNDEVYAGTPNNVGIVKSIDGGLTWNPVNLGIMQSSMFFRTIVGTAAGTVLAGTTNHTIHHTFDGGNNWSWVGPGFKPYGTFSMFVDHADAVFATNGDGVFRSTDQGDTWTQLPSPNSDLYSFTESSRHIIFAGANNVVFRTENNFSTFIGYHVDPHHTLGKVVSLLCTSDDVLFAALDFGGVFMSKDLGITWKNISPDLPTNQMRDIAFTRDGHLVAATQYGIYRMVEKVNPRFRISRTSIQYPPTGIENSCATGLTLTNIGSDDLQYNFSMTTGTHFALSPSSLTLPAFSADSLIVTYSPAGYGTHADTLVVDQDGMIVKIPVTGTSPFPSLKPTSAVLLFPAVAVDSTGIRELALVNTSVNHISIDSITNRTSYYRPEPIQYPFKINAGDTARISVTLQPDTIRTYFDSLRIFHNGASGILIIPLLGSGRNPITLVQENPAIPQSFVLFQNHPNPFNPSTMVSFSVPEESRVTITVHTILGQEIARLSDKDFSPGTYSLNFDGNVSAGIYLYRMTARSHSTGTVFTRTKKMLLMK